MLLPLFGNLALTCAGSLPEHAPDTGVDRAAEQDADTAGDVIREYQDAFADWMAVYSSTTDLEEKEALVPRLPRPDAASGTDRQD